MFSGSRVVSCVQMDGQTEKGNLVGAPEGMRTQRDDQATTIFMIAN
jgi:hypothetical protein